MVHAVKFGRKEFGNLVHPCPIKAVLRLRFMPERGWIGQRHRALDHNGCTLSEALRLGVVKADRDDVGAWNPCSIGFSQRRQEDSSRSRPNSTNFRTAVRGAFWKNQHVLTPSKFGRQTCQSLSISLPRTVRVAGVVCAFNRNHTGEFQ